MQDALLGVQTPERASTPPPAVAVASPSKPPASNTSSPGSKLGAAKESSPLASQVDEILQAPDASPGRFGDNSPGTSGSAADVEERKLAALGKQTVEIFTIAHIFSSRLQVRRCTSQPGRSEYFAGIAQGMFAKLDVGVCHTCS